MFPIVRCIKTLTGHTDAVNVVIENSDGHIVSGSNDMTIRIWDAAKAKCLHVLKGHESSVNALIIARGQLISGSDDHSISKRYISYFFNCFKV